MSNLNELKRFENDLKANKELRKKLDEAVKRIAAEGLAQSDGEVMAAAAKELGYDVSVAALEQAKAEAETLDPEELAAVAGGVEHKQLCSSDYGCAGIVNDAYTDEYDHDSWCVTAWHCYAATLHTDAQDKDVSCWQDYKCLWLNN